MYRKILHKEAKDKYDEAEENYFLLRHINIFIKLTELLKGIFMRDAFSYTTVHF